MRSHWSKVSLLSAFAFSSASHLLAQPTIPEPPPAARVSYAHDIHPFLMRSCATCHVGGKDKGGFQMDTKELFMGSGETGPAIVPGKSAESYLIKLVTGEVEGLLMPMKGKPLSEDEVALLRRWIDEGANWDLDAAPAPIGYKAPLKPRTPDFPQTDASVTHPIDKFLDAYFKQHNITPAPPVSNAVFMRRASLDVAGLVPDPTALRAFEQDTRADKREQLINQILSPNPAQAQSYAEHWMTFWNDALRNDFAGTGYIDGGRKQITPWLYNALYNNMPYDQFVRELVTASNGSEGFIKGIVWRGVTNASMTPAMQAAQNISQVFMGTNLKCASCHDSFVNDWKLKDAYGFAAIFSEEPLELIRCDVPQGEMAEMKFLFPELGTITPTKPQAERLQELAAAMTSPDNGRLSRTIVNRIWAKFMGRGIVEPLDDMEQKPWNEDLLDWLAADLAANKYDLKRTMGLILTSRAYQLPAVGGKEVEEKNFVFAGPVVRRMGAEQFIDSFSSLTDVWQGAPAARLDLSPGESSRQEMEIESQVHAIAGNAQWIWTRAGSDAGAPVGTAYFRRDFKIENLQADPIHRARVYIAADNKFTLFVNGEKIGDGTDWTKPGTFDIGAKFVEGRNVIAVQAENTLEGPAGLFAVVHVRRTSGSTDYSTSPEWTGTELAFNNWEKSDFLPLEWSPAIFVSDIAGSPWLVKNRISDAIASDMQLLKSRAWQVTANPLMRALGRPNREQVTTRRQSVATTLEALELTNGATLTQMLRDGATQLIEKNIAASKEANTDPARLLIEDVYLHSIGRAPNEKETELALAVIGPDLAHQGVEDFLWSVLMLPEFQLIY